MPKSKIIGQLINNEIDLTVAMRRLYVLVNDLGAEEIKAWADKEINGYAPDDELPEYRTFYSCELIFNGINGGFKVSKQPLPLSWISKESVNAISMHKIRSPISEIESNAKADGVLQADRSYLASEIYNQTFDGINGVQAMEVVQLIPAAQFGRIITAIMDKVLKALLELDKKFGCLDGLDIDTGKLKKKERDQLSANLGVIINANKVNVKNSTVGSGSNTSEKTTSIEISPEINITKEEKKECFLKRMFKRIIWWKR